MPILVFEHTPSETPARLGAALRDQGHRLRVVELHEGDSLPPDLDDVHGILALGGPMNVDQQQEYPSLYSEMELIRAAHEREIPVIGLCLGAQLVAKALDGEVAAMAQPEVGWGQVELTFPGTMDPIFAGQPWRTQQFHLHGQEVTVLPAGATPLASSAACPHQAFKVGLTTYAFQYHFEFTRDDIAGVISENEAMIQQAGTSAADMHEATERRYALYRHLGDRLCNALAMLLMPLDKRFGPRPDEPVANFHPARS
jgi:GMP synthase-like glutamine amidotransferase